MCRMMGAVSQKSVKAEWLLAFEPLAAKGKTRQDMPEPGHHDGWGIAAYPRKNFAEYIEREAHSATQDSEHFKKASQFVEDSNSKLALAHFRKISVGKPAMANTHLSFYENWAFAHNGTIFDSDGIPLKKMKPVGQTDSERFFLYLLEKLDGATDPKTVSERLKAAIAELKKNFKYTSLTFLLTDGKSVYAYRDCVPEYNDYYTLYAASPKDGTVICSEPLAAISADWKPLPNLSLYTATA